MSITTVTDGAVLYCTLGTATSLLKIPASHGSGVGGKSQGVISDSVAGTNIMPFGMCKKSNPPAPCTPVICMNWVNGKKDFKINGELALMTICILPCMLGGIIKIKKNG